ncbi:hypothetical protein RHA66_28520 [Pseudomonas aeruginosa]|uniref:hypothetical protein n=1 Tax=Pseudomonas koreensis TaxID=198620 RepID=UPI001E36D935|nr:hypothetical protein [Pseudomonas koreensis]MDR9465676.1 hypothetical protein [Pseudomonas aeruginosa]MDR9475666.1 hypothetical protein [Pseudomonas aeruginosa]
MARELPPFRPVTLDELRSIWSQHPNPDVQRLTLEVVRYRAVIAEIDQLYKITHQAWRDTMGGNLVALHLLQKILDTERERLA